jgi:hypothetical protein
MKLLQQLLENNDDHLRYGVAIEYENGETLLFGESSFYQIPARDIQTARDAATWIVERANVNFGINEEFKYGKLKIVSVGLFKMRYGKIPEGGKEIRVDGFGSNGNGWYLEKRLATPKYKVKPTKTKWVYTFTNHYFPNFGFLIGEGRLATSLPFRILYDRILDSWTIHDSEILQRDRMGMTLAQVEEYIAKNYPIATPIPRDFISKVKVDSHILLQNDKPGGWDRWEFDLDLFKQAKQFKPDSTFDEFIAQLDKYFSKARTTHFGMTDKFTDKYLHAFYKLYQKLA